MPGHRQRQVLGPYARAVVLHADEPLPAVLERHVDARCPGIETVLHKLLDHACGTLDHLACGNLVAQGWRKQVDS